MAFPADFNNLITNRSSDGTSTIYNLKAKGISAWTASEQALYIGDTAHSCYNISDLNRVGEAANYVRSLLTRIGSSGETSYKTTWTTTDVVDLGYTGSDATILANKYHMLAYVEGIKTLYADAKRNYPSSLTFPSVKFYLNDGINSMSISLANRIETFLKQVGQAIYDYVYDSSGNLQNGWSNITTKVYWYENGEKHTGFLVLDDFGKYYFASNGAKQTGWELIDSEYYYFDLEGVMVTGWSHADSTTGAWYYLKPTSNISSATYGKMLHDTWQEIDNKWYRFKSNGVAYASEWVQLGNYWYYFNSSCAAVTGKQTLTYESSTYDYYFYPAGDSRGPECSMAVSTTIRLEDGDYVADAYGHLTKSSS